MKIDWQSKLASLPRGLTIREVAGRVGVSYFITRLAILKHKYPTVDARHFAKKSCRKLKLEKVDWAKSNIAIARASKVSRERVRVIRKQLGKPFVESRGRKLKSPASKPKTKNQNDSKTKVPVVLRR